VSRPICVPRIRIVVAPVDERGFRQVHLGGDTLHPRVIDLRTVEQTHRRRVACERRVGERINLKKSHG